MYVADYEARGQTGILKEWLGDGGCATFFVYAVSMVIWSKEARNGLIIHTALILRETYSNAHWHMANFVGE